MSGALPISSVGSFFLKMPNDDRIIVKTILGTHYVCVQSKKQPSLMEVVAECKDKCIANHIKINYGFIKVNKY